MTATSESKKRPDPKRQKIGKENREWGEFAEQQASDYFVKQGYTVRERNWRCGKYEIDLILEKERTIVFVEVKARKAGTQDPIDAVDRNKRRFIIKAADTYLRNFEILYQYRFDIVTLTGTKDNFKFRHYPDAYMPGLNGG